MLHVGYKKLLLVMCMCSMPSVFGGKSFSVDAGTQTSVDVGTQTDADGLAQKSAIVLKTAGKVLGKTVSVVGTIGLKTLGFTFHHPFLTLGAVGAVCVYSPTARDFVATQAEKVRHTLWEKGKKLIIDRVNDALGLTTVQQETQRQLAALAAASAQHGEQLGRVQEAVGAVRTQTGDIQTRIANLYAIFQERAAVQDAQASQQRLELTGHVARLDGGFNLLSGQIADQGKQLRLLPGVQLALQQLLINSEAQTQHLAALTNGETRRLLPAPGTAQNASSEIATRFPLLVGVPRQEDKREVLD